MPDLTMCSNKICPFRTTCYRAIAKSDLFQSMADFVPVDGKCDYFIEAKSKSQVRRLDIQTKKPKPSSP